MRMECWKIGKLEYWMVGAFVFFLGMTAQAQHECTDPNCTSCAPAAPVAEPEVPAVEAHDEHDHAEHDPVAEEADHKECEGHDHILEEAAHEDHAEEHDEHEGHDPDAHAGHDHAAEKATHEDRSCEGGHEDHAEEEESGLNISHEMAAKIGLKVSVAKKGTIEKSEVFPAEILLNRDRAAAVSPRYASVIRQVFVEVGDLVRKGDVLASLENRETLSVYTVSAPLDGVVMSKDASLGESASEDRILFEIADLSTVWAEISIFPNYQHLIKSGMAVTFVAHDGHTAQGVVKYISPLVSRETRTFTARCVLSGAKEDFTPGVFVRAKISTESADVPVRVERKAVQTVKNSTVVFISDEHGFESRDVVIGMADEQFVEIKRGLSAGESYVSEGSFSLKAQMVTKGMDPHAGHGH